MRLCGKRFESQVNFSIGLRQTEWLWYVQFMPNRQLITRKDTTQVNNRQLTGECSLSFLCFPIRDYFINLLFDCTVAIVFAVVEYPNGESSV